MNIRINTIVTKKDAEIFQHLLLLVKNLSCYKL